MHKTIRIGAAVLAFLGGVAIATVAPAQTSSPATTQGSSGTAQGQIAPTTTDQTQAFIKGLEDLAAQALPGYQPTVGAQVPQGAQTQPMPPAAAQALPQAKDHHVLKTDDQVIMIVDPATGQVVGVITASDASTTGLGTSKGDTSKSK